MIALIESDGREGEIALWDLKRAAYSRVLALQRRLHAARVRGQTGDLLLIAEHEPVLTLGRGADERHLRVPRAFLEARGIAIVPTERGGDITYHGPGQLVAYPILDLRPRACDVRAYIRHLEETAIRLIEVYGIRAERRAGRPGVWVGERKIASVGVWVSRWVTMHGVAINLTPSLRNFDLIEPCGLVGTRMTSVADCSAWSPSVASAADRYAHIFGDVFAVQIRRSAGLAADRPGEVLRGPDPTNPSDRARA